MHERAMEFLACPRCHGDLQLHAFSSNAAGEIETGLLQCDQRHSFPITLGIPRMLPDSLAEHEEALAAHGSKLDTILSPQERRDLKHEAARVRYDRRTKANFTYEWESWERTDGTWGMSQEGQVDGYFVRPMKAIGAESLIRPGSVIFDAGCGPGMPSLGYARLGLEVIALDLSTGLEHGERIRRSEPPSVRNRVHFIQGDLLNPPLKWGIADIVSSLGVISSTPSTKAGFDSIARVLKPDGVFSVWVYSYERGVTEIVESLRAVTTRVPPGLFARVATAAAPAFVAFTWLANKTGIRQYGRMSRKAARIALLDIFGAPYCHHHRFEEVEGWFREHGFADATKVAVSRRGFGAIGARGSLGQLGQESSVGSRAIRAEA